MSCPRGIAALATVLVATVGVACSDDGSEPEANPDWPPRVSAGELRRITAPDADAEPADGVAVEDVSFGFVPDMVYDEAQERLIVSNQPPGPSSVLAVERDGRVDVLVGTDTEVPRTRSGSRGNARLSLPSDLALGPDGTVYFVERARFAVLARRPGGDVVIAAGRYDPSDSPPTEGLPTLDIPVDVAVGPDGTLYVPDLQRAGDAHRIWSLTDDRPPVTMLLGPGGTLGDDAPPGEILVEGSTLWFVSATSIITIDLDTGDRLDRTPAVPLPERLFNPVVVAGVLYVTGGGGVWQLTTDGGAEEIVTTAQLGDEPADALASDGSRLYIMASSDLWSLGL